MPIPDYWKVKKDWSTVSPKEINLGDKVRIIRISERNDIYGSQVANAGYVRRTVGKTGVVRCIYERKWSNVLHDNYIDVASVYIDGETYWYFLGDLERVE